MKPIPTLIEPNSYSEIRESNSNFVEIKDNECFLVRMQYPLLQINNCEEQCLVRKEVYNRLLLAYKFLPHGYKFLILDAWRPFELQRELYFKYFNDIIFQYGYSSKSKVQQECLVKKFVSFPTKSRKTPPVHTTGGAIDLSIVDSYGNELNMGSKFDEFGDVAHTDFFEKSDENDIKNNRRLLYWAMVNAGFTNFPSEWWHYDFGDGFWGFYKKQEAMFGGCFTKEEMIVEE